jgi:hypothetical protein
MDSAGRGPERGLGASGNEPRAHGAGETTMKIVKIAGRISFVLACVLLCVPTLAGAQAVLYELTENAQVSMSGGLFGRHAHAALQGSANVGTPVCPQTVLALSPNALTCTITAIGTDVVDAATGRGTIAGTWATVVQLDNAVDAPEGAVLTGSFSGDVDLSLALNKVAPLGFVTNGTFKVDGADATLSFSGTFRLPFAMLNGKRVNAHRVQAAYYLGDDGAPFPVKPSERALGWPTVRLEVKFQ